MTQGSGTAPAPPVAPARAWYALAIFVLLYCLSFLDRLVLALLAAPVSASLHISDTSLGLLFGVGFGVLYALCGLPIAHLVDRSHRVRLVALGVFLWSACTIASGFAGTYMELVFARSGVAIGEAVLSPAAISLIADMFARERRTLPTSVYTSVPTFMSTGAFVAGGFALALATTLSATYPMEPWRLTLVLVGAPGLLLAPLLLLTVREPARAVEAHETKDYTSARQAFAYVRTEGRLYGFIFLGMAAYTIMSFAFTAWTPTILIRAHHMEPAQAGYAFGMAGLIAGVIGTLCWPALVKYWTRSGRKDAIVIVLTLGLSVAAVSAFAIGLAPSVPALLTAVATYTFFGGVSALLPPLIIQYIAPGRVRARLMAANLLASNLIGLTIGPALCAWLAENVFEGPNAMGQALASIACVFGPICALAMLIARPRYARALDLASARDAEEALGRGLAPQAAS